MDPRWQHPFTCIVAGPTGCGKTTFVARLLRNASAMIDPPPERVTWYYGEWQTAYENLDIPNMRLEEGLPTSFDNGKRGLVVLPAALKWRTAVRVRTVDRSNPDRPAS